MKPIISVVIPTYNRKNLLNKQLIALTHQTVDQQKYEIIVVDDGSTDGTDTLLEFWSNEVSNFRYILQKNEGPAKARNKGVQIAKGSIIAFTDDDCIVHDDWIEMIDLKFKSHHTALALQGETKTDRKRTTPLTHQVENTSYRTLTLTCNMAVKKEVFEQIGGFSTDYPYPHNEDTDLSWKIMEIGHIEFFPKMRVFHPPIQRNFFKQVERMEFLKSEFTLFNNHPIMYKKFRSPSPWHTLFLEVGVTHFLRNMKSTLKFVTNPSLFIKGLGIQLLSEAYLVYLIPEFIKSSLNNQTKLAK